MALDLLHLIYKEFILTVIRRFFSYDCYSAIEGRVVFDTAETEHCHQRIFVSSKGIKSPPGLSAVFNDFDIFGF